MSVQGKAAGQQIYQTRTLDGVARHRFEFSQLPMPEIDGSPTDFLDLESIIGIRSCLARAGHATQGSGLAVDETGRIATWL